MNASLAHRGRRAYLAAPALAGTAASAVLTIAVVTLWLGPLIGTWLAMLIGAGFDGAWLAALAYERRLAAQGDHNPKVTLTGWLFGLAATGLLVAHALTAGAGTSAWLAVSWLPLAAKALWWLHSLWEATEVSPRARMEISRVLQDSRDSAAISRATLNAQAGIDIVRTQALAAAGAGMAKAQSKAARRLAEARTTLENTAGDEREYEALTAVAAPRWDLPAWTPVAAVRPQAAAITGGAETASAQASEAQAITPARISTAAGVRHLVNAEGITDPKEVLSRLPEVTGRSEHNRQTVLREIRNAKSTSSVSGAKPFGFAAGRN